MWSVQNHLKINPCAPLPGFLSPWLPSFGARRPSPRPKAAEPPELTAVAGEDAIELSWNEIENAARYQLWFDGCGAFPSREEAE